MASWFARYLELCFRLHLQPRCSWLQLCSRQSAPRVLVYIVLSSLTSLCLMDVPLGRKLNGRKQEKPLQTCRQQCGTICQHRRVLLGRGFGFAHRWLDHKLDSIPQAPWPGMGKEQGHQYIGAILARCLALLIRLLIVCFIEPKISLKRLSCRVKFGIFLANPGWLYHHVQRGPHAIHVLSSPHPRRKHFEVLQCLLP